MSSFRRRQPAVRASPGHHRRARSQTAFENLVPTDEPAALADEELFELIWRSPSLGDSLRQEPTCVGRFSVQLPAFGSRRSGWGTRLNSVPLGLVAQTQLQEDQVVKRHTPTILTALVLCIDQPRYYGFAASRTARPAAAKLAICISEYLRERIRPSAPAFRAAATAA